MFSFIETRLFTRLVLEYLSDDEYGALQQALVGYPESGPLLGAGSAVGTANIPAHILRQIRKEVEDD